jgi:DNA-binding NarL/FixJ family response regulator
MSTRILLIDDQELLRMGFRMVLDAQSDLEVVGEAGDGAEGVKLAGELEPDVILMDVRMPGMDGIAATAAICAHSAARVLVLTTFDLDEHVYDALRAGASGFLLKDVRRQELVDAVRVVAAGEALLAPTVTRRLIADLVRRAPARPRLDPRLATRLATLTARETDTLREIASGRSNAEIAAVLHVTEHTVKTHVSNVLAKLQLRDRVQVVVFAYESGLVAPGEAGGGRSG